MTIVDINRIKEQEREIFSQLNMHCDFFIDRNHDNWQVYAPHHYARDPAILTQQFIENMQKGAKLLSVGCGPAYLEQFMIKAYNINLKNIILSDDLKLNIPKEFTFYKFNMYNSWPDMNNKFDYIIFPESVFFERLGPDEGLTHIIVESTKILNPRGEVRIKGHGIEDNIVKNICEGLSEKLNISEFYFAKDYLALKKN
jgi:hypothetical protein